MQNRLLKKINPFIPFTATFPLPYVIPVYHVVSNDYLPHLKHIINYKNTKEFEKDLDDLSKLFHFVEWDFFKDNFHIKNNKPYALLTFDDGLSQFREVIIPILLRKGIYAINFINPAFIDNKDMMFRLKTSLLIDKIKSNNKFVRDEMKSYLHLNTNSAEEAIRKIKAIKYENQNRLNDLAHYLNVDFEEFVSKEKIYLNRHDLDFAKSNGFGIAAHSWDHPYLADLPLDSQLSTVKKSINYMIDHHYTDNCFSFPFTDYNLKKEFFEKMFAHNTSLQISFGTAGVKQDCITNNLQRIPMENGFSALEELKFESNYYQLKKLFNKNIIHRP